MTSETGIVIADDHPIFRKGLREIVDADSRFRVVREAGDGAEALKQIEEFQPSIVILDVDMPEVDGFRVVQELRRRKIAVDIIFLTIHSEEDILNEALTVGVKGYVLKDSASTEIINAIDAVLQGHHYTSPSITTQLINRAQRVRSPQGLSVDKLTTTERHILRLIAEYKTSKQIADELFIHHRTVENHRTNISAKLGLHGSHALIKFALKNKSEL